MKYFALAVVSLLVLGMGRKPPENNKEKAMEASSMMIPDAHWNGLQSQVTQAGHKVITDAESWKNLWTSALGSEAPEVDFSKRFAVAVFAGTRHTGGYSVEFLAPEMKDGTLVVRYKVRAPSAGGFVIQAFTQPYGIQLFAAAGKPVRVEEVR